MFYDQRIKNTLPKGSNDRDHTKQQHLTITFIIVLFVVQGMLLSTAWRGAELVFRYGLGVMSLPQAEDVGHDHHQHH